jgi:excisionase family DNA binding protein
MDRTSSSGGIDAHRTEGLAAGDHLLRVGEVARALGASVRQVWKLTADGALPAPGKLGKSTRWRASDIHE